MDMRQPRIRGKDDPEGRSATKNEGATKARSTSFRQEWNGWPEGLA
jgi:hypothetical protein